MRKGLDEKKYRSERKFLPESQCSSQLEPELSLEQGPSSLLHCINVQKNQTNEFIKIDKKISDDTP